MTRIEKLINIIEQTFNVKAKYPKNLELFVNCEGCPMEEKCNEIDMCCIDDWWNEEYKEPKTEWIPVTERLPKKTGKYLVTVRNGNVYAGTFDETSGRFQCAATAWMPLPEPYQSND